MSVSPDLLARIRREGEEIQRSTLILEALLAKAREEPDYDPDELYWLDDGIKDINAVVDKIDDQT